MILFILKREAFTTRLVDVLLIDGFGSPELIAIITEYLTVHGFFHVRVNA
jgi:hypothetical protein